MLEVSVMEDFGFTAEEIEEIGKIFIVSLDYEDWGSIELKDNLDDEDIVDSENYLKLSTGRVAVFPYDLLDKEQLAQID